MIFISDCTAKKIEMIVSEHAIHPTTFDFVSSCLIYRKPQIIPIGGRKKLPRYNMTWLSSETEGGFG
jgi:hypothetical protein